MNRLAKEPSPYLKQHSQNPVDWYPWGEEALARARKNNRPIFLSIGYAACHWCHVMERESFEDPAVAAFLNKHFVPVKVDREERPDIDHLYMASVQLMTGSGGWPLSVFLTPDLIPFYGGTYFPPETKWGKPGFLDVLKELVTLYENSPEKIAGASEEVHRRLKETMRIEPGDIRSSDWARRLVAYRRRALDPVHGGFGLAPKFPTVPDLAVFAALDPSGWDHMLTTLNKIALGGIHDHVGGGFHRYSTTEDWRVPHYEKMLYDQALLLSLYVTAYRRTKDPLYRRVIERGTAFLGREMYRPGLGFITSLDADSEEEEGKYYVWSRNEVVSVLGKEKGEYFVNLTHLGEDPSPIHLTERVDDPEAFDEVLKTIAKIRSRRIRPGEDTKVLTSINGLTIGALAHAGAVLNRGSLVELAGRAADDLIRQVFQDGRLRHAVPGTAADVDGLLEDYAYLAHGLLALFETTGTLKYLKVSRNLLTVAGQKFPDAGLASNRALPVLPRDLGDGALPSPAGVLLLSRYRLNAITGEHEDEVLISSLKALAGTVDRMPAAHSSLVYLSTLMERPPMSVVIAGMDREEVCRAAWLLHGIKPGLDGVIPAWASDLQSFPSVKGKKSVEGKATYYMCRGSVCLPPTTNVSDVEHTLRL